jgi:thymidylate kinase
MKLLIIEGPDLSGKSTAIEKIAKLLNNGFTIKNNYKPKDHNSKKIYYTYRKYLDMIKCEWFEDVFVIFDRFYPSQAVYSILRGTEELYSFEIKLLEKETYNLGGILIYLDTKEKDLLKRYDHRGDEHVKKEQLLMIKRRYDEFYEMTILPKIKIDTTEKDWLEKLIKFIYK